MQGLVKSSTDLQDDGVLVEAACESNGKCDIDQRAFKGIASRSFARAAISAPNVADSIKTMLTASAKGAASACQEDDNDISCRLSWTDSNSKWESATAKAGNLGEVFAALEVVQGLLYPQAKAVATNTGQRSGSSSGNATQSGDASGTSSSTSPQHTSLAVTIPVSITTSLIVTLAVALSF